MSTFAQAQRSRLVQIIATAIVACAITAGTVLAAMSTVGGTIIDVVRVVRSTDPSQTNSQPWVDIAGASASVGVAAGGGRGLILARFSAESVCYPTLRSTAADWCSVRIMLGSLGGATVEMDPAAGTDFAFDSTNDGRETSTSWESHSMDRSKGPLNVGPYRVYAQMRTSSSNVVLRVDDWSLTVEKVRAP